MANRLTSFCIAATIGLGCTASAAHAAAPAPANTHCAAPEYRQFDFWLGDWDTYRVDDSGKVPAGAPSVARNHVTSILDGCVLREDYRRPDGYAGESFTIYDASRKRWHQSWVTNEGELLEIDGGFAGGKIVLGGESRDDQGDMKVRASWVPQGDGVRETALVSRDGGKTWKPLFDLLFRPHRQ
jgi:hypothetical protein